MSTATDESTWIPVPAGQVTTVFGAWSAAMEDVRAIGKESRNKLQNYDFRGIDAVMDAVGPVLRKHGLVVIPFLQSIESERYQTAKGAEMVGRVLTVRYRVYGPAGDHFEGVVSGEASDSGDKATPKAMSVAYRTFLLQALSIPTGERDPDSYSYERAPEPVTSIARDTLRELATAKGWDLTRVAAVFAERVGGELRSAPDDLVDVFRLGLESGAVTL